MITSAERSFLIVASSLALLVAACGAKPKAQATEEPAGPVPEWQRGVFPPPSAIVPDAPPEKPVTEADKKAFAAKVTATCPPGTEEDPLPGLSAPARSFKPSRHRQYRSRPLMREEIKALLQILAGMAPSDPDRPKVIERLASDYFLDEWDLYHDCLNLLLVVETDRSPLSELEARLNETRGHLEAAHANGLAMCNRLAQEHPEHKPRELCGALP